MPAATERAAHEVRRRILAGRYPPGVRLPPERELASELGVHRLTLRAALADLTGEGLVRPRQGDGVRVLEWRRTASLALLPHLVEHARETVLSSLLELRRAVAAEAVAMACRRATAEDLGALEALAAAQEGERSRAAFAERDLAFGRAVVLATGNLAFELLLNTVEHLYRAHPEVAAALLADRDVNRRSYRA